MEGPLDSCSWAGVKKRMKTLSLRIELDLEWKNTVLFRNRSSRDSISNNNLPRPTARTATKTIANLILDYQFRLMLGQTQISRVSVILPNLQGKKAKLLGMPAFYTQIEADYFCISAKEEEARFGGAGVKKRKTACDTVAWGLEKRGVASSSPLIPPLPSCLLGDTQIGGTRARDTFDQVDQCFGLSNIVVPACVLQCRIVDLLSIPRPGISAHDLCFGVRCTNEYTFTSKYSFPVPSSHGR